MCDGAPASHPEKESCRTCPNRMRCHGKRPDITQDTILKLIRETTLEVIREYEAKRGGRSS